MSLGEGALGNQSGNSHLLPLFFSLTQSRNAVLRRADENVDAPARERETRGPSGRRNQHALRQELLHDAAPTRAERRAHRNFLAARCPARQQQIHDVRARDEQHDANGTQQHEQRTAGVADD